MAKEIAPLEDNNT